MPNSLPKTAILIVVMWLIGRPSIAQQTEKPEPTKPIAFRGSFEATVDDKGNLILTPTIIAPVTEERQATRTVCKTVIDQQEESYTVDVGGKKETRTRTVNVPRQVSEQVPYTYNVTVGKPEVQAALTTPKLYYFNSSIDLGLPISPLAPFAANVQSSKDVLFVSTTSEVLLAVQIFYEANRRHIELTGISPPSPYYIVVLEEKFDAAEVEKNRESRMVNSSITTTLTMDDVRKTFLGLPRHDRNQ